MINIIPSQEITRIYLVTNCYGNPNKVYIGKEKIQPIKSRYYEHKKRFGHQIIFTYIDQIESLNSKDWKPLECFWIEYFRQLGFDLQNKNDGVGGSNIITLETRIKMSQSHKDKKLSQETKSKMSLIRTGNKHSNETRLKMSLSKQNMSQETKNKMSLAAKGKKKSLEIRNKMKEYRNKPILQYDLEGNFIKEWSSAKEASQKLNINRNGISSVCNNKNKSSGKFIWKFKH